MKDNKKILWTLFITVLIDMLGIGILIPVFPSLVVPNSPLKITPNSWTAAEGFIMLGWLSTCFPLMQFLCAPILGQLSDRYGRKRVLALSIMGTASSYVLFAIGIFTKNLPLLFISRALDGASGGNISVAQAAISDISSPENRAKNFGLIGMAFGVGFIIGPFIGGVLSDHTNASWFNAATPFCFAAFISIINVILILKFLPETLEVKSVKRIDITRPIANIYKALTSDGLKNVLPTSFLANAGFTFYVTFWGVVLAEQFGFSQSGVGNYFAYVGIMIILAQGLVVRRVSGKIEDYKILRFSLFGTGLCLFTYYFIPNSTPALIFLIPPFMAVFNSLTMAFTSTLITRVTPNNIRGEAMGIASSVNALAQSIPSILAGYIAAHHARLPVLIGSLLLFTGGLVFWKIFKPEKFNYK